jgi:hypothetical protein
MGSFRVIIIDDEPDTRSFLRAYWRWWCFEMQLPATDAETKVAQGA